MTQFMKSKILLLAFLIFTSSTYAQATYYIKKELEGNGEEAQNRPAEIKRYNTDFTSDQGQNQREIQLLREEVSKLRADVSSQKDLLSTQKDLISNIKITIDDLAKG